MVFKKILFSLFFITKLIKLSAQDESILSIIEVIGHGAKTPDHIFKDVEWMRDYQKEELTLKGARQHYATGQEIRKRYKDLINGELDANQIWIRSTFYNRTIQSAISHLYGMFKINKTNLINYSQNDARVLLLFSPDPEVSFNSIIALPINYIP